MCGTIFIMSHTKVCGRCGTERDADMFTNDKTRRDGKSPTCKPCRRENENAKAREYMRKHRATPEGRRRFRSSQMKSVYGITLDQYEQMLADQNYKCAICGIDKCQSGKGFSIDHDHATGAVRGLLCFHCNSAIGKLGDSPERCRAAADYLEASRALEE